MKSLMKFVLAAVLFATTFTADADLVLGHFRSNGTYVAPYCRSGGSSLKSNFGSGYVYRNPYAAAPSVGVKGYYRDNQTFVSPHSRTAPNSTVTDNLNYRGFGTVRVPRGTYGW